MPSPGELSSINAIAPGFQIDIKLKWVASAISTYCVEAFADLRRTISADSQFRRHIFRWHTPRDHQRRHRQCGEAGVGKAARQAQVQRHNGGVAFVAQVSGQLALPSGVAAGFISW